MYKQYAIIIGHNIWSFDQYDQLTEWLDDNVYLHEYTFVVVMPMFDPHEQFEDTEFARVTYIHTVGASKIVSVMAVLEPDTDEVVPDHDVLKMTPLN